MDILALAPVPANEPANIITKPKAASDPAEKDNEFSAHLEKNVERFNKTSRKPEKAEQQAEVVDKDVETAEQAVETDSKGTSKDTELEQSKVAEAAEPSADEVNLNLNPVESLLNSDLKGIGRDLNVSELASKAASKVADLNASLQPNGAALNSVAATNASPLGQVSSLLANQSGKELPQVDNTGAALHSQKVSFDPLAPNIQSGAENLLSKKGFLRPLSPALDNSAGLPQGESMANLILKSAKPQLSVEKQLAPLNAAVTSDVASTTALPPLSTSVLATNDFSLTSTKPVLTLDTPVNNPRWGSELGKNVQWMMSQSVSGAQIRLNPQQLGPIEVRLQMENGQASIAFTAQHLATREALDAAMPRLREMLDEQNIDLLDANVSEHSFSEQQQQESGDFANAAAQDESLANNPLFNEENEAVLTHDGLFSKFA